MDTSLLPSASAAHPESPNGSIPTAVFPVAPRMFNYNLTPALPPFIYLLYLFLGCTYPVLEECLVGLRLGGEGAGGVKGMVDIQTDFERRDGIGH